jgi:hypothetical protein
MRNCLTVLLNIVFQKDLELLYGKGTLVEVNDFKYCTTTKNYTVDCTLILTDIVLFEESNVGGLQFLVEESLKYTGLEKNTVTLITSYDLREIQK